MPPTGRAAPRWWRNRGSDTEEAELLLRRLRFFRRVGLAGDRLLTRLPRRRLPPAMLCRAGVEREEAKCNEAELLLHRRHSGDHLLTGLPRRRLPPAVLVDKQRKRSATKWNCYFVVVASFTGARLACDHLLIGLPRRCLLPAVLHRASGETKEVKQRFWLNSLATLSLSLLLSALYSFDHLLLRRRRGVLCDDREEALG